MASILSVRFRVVQGPVALQWDVTGAQRQRNRRVALVVGVALGLDQHVVLLGSAVPVRKLRSLVRAGDDLHRSVGGVGIIDVGPVETALLGAGGQQETSLFQLKRLSSPGIWRPGVVPPDHGFAQQASGDIGDVADGHDACVGR